MAKTTCKLCYRRFASPRALAGHMRAHSIAAAKSSQISSASSASTSVVAGDDDADAGKGYVLREKPKRRVRLAESADFSDRESETTAGFPSPPPSAAKRAGSGDAEPVVSSVSDGATTPEEDVALSLMMLSRDTWPSPSPPPPPPPSYSDDEEEEEGSGARPVGQKRTRYECPACKKVFRSYQALGGHRASNVRGGKGGCCAAPPPPLTTPPPSPMQQRPLPAYEGPWKLQLQPHQCPHCYRVFSSGQALGGHRRSHHCSAAPAAAPIADPPVAMKSLGFIDLNLPAAFDDVELSAVSSDPFLSSKPGS
ncbi:hypothetical protein PR202_gb14756 [Eleusine coracana subsp. coracana]|uniref:C2H2-type domain-containing protein n=1 Tax=Eleusine coracana subsp. coracana TaxID=191504 RepID=A0AAV5EW40_ELECO|nr:hypothetical protein QOZ80_4BG0339150 [Eleusine coracana subsp. coracana]GJN26796.1 hypothetical protein PR202_gb14756 [Eleusine coracana subsp. coracana]